MSKTKAPLLSLGARKSIAGAITFRRGKRVYHAQTKFTPKDPRTADQISIRTAMKELQGEWHNLTPEQKEAWENYVTEGRHKYQSGYSIFLKENFVKYHNTGNFSSWPDWNLKLVLTTGEKLTLTTGEKLVVNLGD
jgi:hypothetical protein